MPFLFILLLLGAQGNKIRCRYQRFKSQGGLLFGPYPDSQRYFDDHHTEADRFETINKCELELGAGAMTALVYLLDKYGLLATHD